MTTVLEAVAESLDLADSILESEGYEVDESIDDPDKYLNVLADIFEDESVTFSEEGEAALEAVCDLLHWALDEEIDESEDLTERSDFASLMKKVRRQAELTSKSGKDWGGGKDELAAREKTIGAAKPEHLGTSIASPKLKNMYASSARRKASMAALKSRLADRKKAISSGNKFVHPEDRHAKLAAEKEAELDRKAAERVAQDRAASKERFLRGKGGLKALRARQDIGHEPQDSERLAKHIDPGPEYDAPIVKKTNAQTGVSVMQKQKALRADKGRTRGPVGKVIPRPNRRKAGESDEAFEKRKAETAALKAGEKGRKTLTHHMEVPQKTDEWLEPEVESQIAMMSEMVERAGYGLDEDLDVCEFLEAVGILLDGDTLSEGVASDLTEGLKRVQGKCGCFENVEVTEGSQPGVNLHRSERYQGWSRKERQMDDKGVRKIAKRNLQKELKYRKAQKHPGDDY